MDTLDTYRQCIEQVLYDYAQLPYAYGEVEREVVSDRHGDHYLLLAVGWDGAQRVHGSVVHIDIINGKVWIQRDGTEQWHRRGVGSGRDSSGPHRVGLSPSRPQAVHGLRRGLSHTRCDAPAAS